MNAAKDREGLMGPEESSGQAQPISPHEHPSRSSSAATCPECGAIQWGNAFCQECRSHWADGDPVCGYCHARPAASYGVGTPRGRILWSGGCRECAEKIALDTGGIVVRIG